MHLVNKSVLLYCVYNSIRKLTFYFQTIQKVFEQVHREDVTLASLTIAHRLSTIRFCDLIHVLHKGRIVESGTHADLILQRGIYYTMLAKDHM